MNKKATFTLINALKKRYEHRGSWNAVEKAIYDANGKDKNSKVDRRTLKRLVEDGDESVKLSVIELRAIDQYLKPFNDGLAENPIFIRNEDILDSFMGSGFIEFIISAKYHEGRRTEAVSRWDMKAVTELIQSQLNDLKIKVNDVLDSDPCWSLLEKKVRNDEPDITSIITVGSPLANPASENILANMIPNLKPHERIVFDCKHPLPFYFFYPDMFHNQDFPSTFFLKEEELKKVQENKKSIANISDNRTRAIIINNEIYYSTRKNHLIEDHALLVAQRQQPFGNISMALCGISGPATLGLAKIISEHKINLSLPKLTEGQPQPILLAVIQVELVENHGPSNYRDKRQLINYQIIKPPHLLYYVNQQWKRQDET